MAGYAGYSMSNNAVQAYNEGKLPLSKITRKKLDEHGISMSADMFKWLCKYKNIVKPCEWHHTSMDYNETDFYDLRQASKILTKIDLVTLKEEYKKWKDTRKPKKKDNTVSYALVSYKVPSGLGKKRRYHEREEYAVIFNGWAYLSSGSKKNIEGKRFWIVEQYDDRPEQIPESLVANVIGKSK